MTDQGNPAEGSVAVELAAEILRLRTEAGLSQRNLAGRIGYTRQYIQAAERADGVLPSPSLIRAIDDGLGACGGLTALRDRAVDDQKERRRAAAKQQPNGARSASLHQTGDVIVTTEEWLRVRNAPGVRGRELTELEAWLYPQTQRAPGGHVLAGQGWLLDAPIPLDSARLLWSDGTPTGSAPHLV